MALDGRFLHLFFVTFLSLNLILFPTIFSLFSSMYIISSSHISSVSSRGGGGV